MTGLRDRAAGGGPEVVRASELRSQPPCEVAESDLYAADDLTPEETFPQYGEFLRVVADDDEERYWECPVGLASGIVEIADSDGIEPVGAFVDVVSAHKSADGEWRFQLQVAESRDALL